MFHPYRRRTCHNIFLGDRACTGAQILRLYRMGLDQILLPKASPNP